MTIKKYIPSFMEGFKEDEFDVDSKEELMKIPFIKSAVEIGDVCFSQGLYNSHIMLVIPNKDKSGYTQLVLSIIDDKNDAEILCNWLPDYEKMIKKYRLQK